MMNAEKLFLAIGSVDDDLLDRNEKNEKRIHILRRYSIAACFVLITCLVIFAVYRFGEDKKSSTAAGVPSIVIDGITFCQSGWDTAVEAPPQGFEYSGIIETTNTDGKFLVKSQYYLNADIPEWAYVYCKTWNEFNQEKMAYVRYVTTDLRWNVFINYDGKTYVSLKNYTTGVNPSQAFIARKLDLEERYGLSVETTVPAGCQYVGTAHLEELDRKPQTMLGINSEVYDKAAVYANLSDNQVLYVGTAWKTTASGKGEEAVHSGYDVFVLYDPS